MWHVSMHLHTHTSMHLHTQLQLSYTCTYVCMCVCCHCAEGRKIMWGVQGAPGSSRVLVQKLCIAQHRRALHTYIYMYIYTTKHTYIHKSKCMARQGWHDKCTSICDYDSSVCKHSGKSISATTTRAAAAAQHSKWSSWRIVLPCGKTTAEKRQDDGKCKLPPPSCNSNNKI